jgi:hypothetical protein
MEGQSHTEGPNTRSACKGRAMSIPRTRESGVRMVWKVLLKGFDFAQPDNLCKCYTNIIQEQKYFYAAAILKQSV